MKAVVLSPKKNSKSGRCSTCSCAICRSLRTPFLTVILFQGTDDARCSGTVTLFPSWGLKVVCLLSSPIKQSCVRESWLSLIGQWRILQKTNCQDQCGCDSLLEELRQSSILKTTATPQKFFLTPQTLHLMQTPRSASPGLHSLSISIMLGSKCNIHRARFTIPAIT